MDIQIKYNPYSLCTIVSERNNNEWEPCEYEWVKYLQGKQLQTWFRKDQHKNWRGFCAEVATALNEKVKIFYEGRESDYKDFVTLIEHDKFEIIKPESFSLNDAEAIKKLTEIRDAIAVGDYCETDQVKEAIENYENMKNGWFDIAVVATMSSGKSTLINALMRGNYMPTGNMATTAKVVRIFNKDEQAHFSYKSYDKEGTLLGEGELATHDVMNEMNGSDEVFRIDITGNIPGISNSDFMNLRLIDTPGPNNSATDEHKEVAFSVIGDKKKQPMILFIQDSTKLEEMSEYSLLKEISDAMKESLQAQERFIFVMNRSDQIDYKKEDIKNFVAKEKSYLSTKFGIAAPQIIPIAAQAGFLQSLADTSERTGEPMDEEYEDDLASFRKKLKNPSRDLVSAADLSPTVRTTIESEKTEANDSVLTMINCGIKGLELTIDEYLKKYAMPFKIFNCKQAMMKQLKDLRALHNYRMEISENKAALEQSEIQLSKIQSRLDKFKLESKEFHTLVSSVGEDSDWKVITRQATEDLTFSVYSSIDISDCEEIKGDDGRKYIEKGDAKSILRKVDKKLKSSIDTMKEWMCKELDNKLQVDFAPRYEKCREIINEFKDLFDKIEGLDASALPSFENLLESFDEAEEFRLDSYLKTNPIQERTTTITTLHERTVANPAKKGFFGWLKFWQPETITETYSKETHYDNLVLVSDLRQTLNEYIDGISFKSEEVIESAVKDIYNQKRDDLIERSQYMTDTIQKESNRIKKVMNEVKEKRKTIEELELEEQRACIVDKWIATLNTLGNVG